MFSLLTIALILLIAVSLYPVLFGGAPYVATPTATLRRALQLAQVKPGETVFDLGCGDGRMLCLAVREFEAVGVGVEVNPLLVWWARRRCRGLPVTVQRGRLEEVDLSAADVVYIFLLPGMMEQVGRLSGLRPGTRLVSHGFSLPNQRPAKVEGNCYLYFLGGVL